MKYTKLITSLFFVGLLLFGCGTSDEKNPPAAMTPPAATTPPATGELSVSITHETSVVTINGETIPVKVTTEGFIFVGHEGKLVLFEFYGDTCPHCINAIPMYNKLEAKYGNRILILTIESYGRLNNAGLQDYASSKNIQYRTVAKENSGNVKAYAEELVGSMPGVPYLIILDKNGVIVANRFNEQDESWVEGMILDLL